MSARRLPILIALLVVLQACQSPSPAPPLPLPGDQPTLAALDGPTPGLSPLETAQAYYDWLLAFPGSVLVNDTYKVNEVSRQYLSDAFIARVDEILTKFVEAPGAGYDPLFCAQEKPSAISFELLARTDTTAVLLASRSFAGGDPTIGMRVDMLRQEQGWVINDVTCIAPAVDVPTPTPRFALTRTPAASEHWKEYHSREYRFQVMLPAEWSAFVAPVADPQDLDPVEAYITFVAAAERLPVAFVVVSGSLSDLRLIFPEPEDGGERQVINGRTVLVEQHFSGETYYILQPPPGAPFHLMLRVISRGASLSADLQQTVERMLATFRYTDAS